MAKRAVKRVRVTQKQIDEHRSRSKQDHSPKWAGHESWSSEEFTRAFYRAMDYYSSKFSSKELKPIVIKWMEANQYSLTKIEVFKKLPDWHVSSTIGGIADCLLKGMPPCREDFNHGRDSSMWLKNEIDQILAINHNNIEPEIKTVTVNIQDRTREIAISMVGDLDTAIDDFYRQDIKDFANINVVALLKNKNVKSVHARIISGFYQDHLNELLELAGENPDPQLREGYNTSSRKRIKQLIAFYQDIIAACGMIKEEVKVARKPRAKKVISKDKLVAKLQYKKIDDQLKLVSLDPVTVIGSKELWVYDTKSRKMGRYIALDASGLGIKNSSIVGFDPNISIQKTIRKPDETLPTFKTLGKIPLRKFLDQINTVDIKLTGRINENVILLRVD